MDNNITRRKKEILISNLKEMESVVVAFSGGVDSSFLLAVAHETLGEKVIAATAKSAIHPSHETRTASQFVLEKGIRHIVFRSDEMKNSDFIRNDADRCYYCKRRMLKALFRISQDEEIKNIAHGANTDDLNDFRPGFRAAQETSVIAPLIDAKLNKEEIRFLSRKMGLSTWDKPPMACLASRIPYGSRITEEKLNMVEKAESFLFSIGFKQVRVRHHGSLAKLEIGWRELANFTGEKLRVAIIDKFREIGYAHIAVDLEGYISGKMNRSLEDLKNIEGDNK